MTDRAHSDEALVEHAKALPRVLSQVDGQEIRRAIVVPGKLVNLVASPRSGRGADAVAGREG